MRRPAVLGRVTRVELCQCQDSLLLMVGPVSLRLDFRAAEDVAMTLSHALSLLTPNGAAGRERSGSQESTHEATVGQTVPPAADLRRGDGVGDPDEWDVPTLPEPFGPHSN